MTPTGRTARIAVLILTLALGLYGLSRQKSESGQQDTYIVMRCCQTVAALTVFSGSVPLSPSDTRKSMIAGWKEDFSSHQKTTAPLGGSTPVPKIQ